ncbi:hypothetical protein GWI33_020150 [Rhynchophorus ferrugineus]|uniref:Uncharacterized protein n=1 Tax=Rhynchophorus ferrugineus TaxID=354439 RepID=A0A834HQ09_RHYFE|nr:hypothetical protein GWI33_020150 [Rhynchophorus ferrugineus]
MWFVIYTGRHAPQRSPGREWKGGGRCRPPRTTELSSSALRGESDSRAAEGRVGEFLLPEGKYIFALGQCFSSRMFI